MDEQEKIVIEVEESELEEQEKVKKAVVRVLKFRLQDEHYCVHVTQVKEVIRVPEVTRLPLVPGFVKGVINLRGQIIAVLDIREFFGLSEAGKPTDPRIIITDAAGYTVGILADSCEGTDDIEEGLIQEPLATLKQELRNYTKGQVQQQDRIIILLDLERVLKSQEIENLRGER